MNYSSNLTKPTIVNTKSHKLSSALRKQQVLALQLAGLTQAQIADQLGVTPRTIARDVSDLQPTKEVVISTIDRAKKRIAEMMPVEKRIDRYVDFAMHAKTEAVGYSSLVRLDDLDDIVTQKELVRTRRDEASQPAAMFVLNANMQVSFGPDTTSSGRTEASQSLSNAIDITPTPTPDTNNSNQA